MKNINIYLIPKWEVAQKFCSCFDATIEAEYGDNVLKGNTLTLAHHIKEFKNCPAPCNNFQANSEVFLPLNDNVLNVGISHIDLDTIGGLAALLGYKYSFQSDFWSVAEFIDVNGPHHIHKFPQKIQDLLNAYYGWSSENRFTPTNEDIIDVTETVYQHFEILDNIFQLNGENDLIKKGREWATNIQETIEKLLIEENKDYRVFITNGVFCNASYYSPALKTIAKVIVVLNKKFNAITISCSDNSINCCQIVQSLWGNEAGGREGIAGSPRGKQMTEQDLQNVINYIATIFNYKILGCNRCQYTWRAKDDLCCPICGNPPTHEN